MLFGLMLVPVLAVSLLATGKITAVLNGVVAVSGVAAGVPGGLMVTAISAWLLGCPRLSLIVYGMVAVPTKPGTGVKVTLPVGSLENVPCGVVKVVWTPGVFGSRSRVVGSSVVPGALESLATALTVTGLSNKPLPVSDVAVGTLGGSTVTAMLALLLG